MLERLLTLFYIVESASQSYLQGDSLVGDCLKLTWRINKLLPDVVCKPENSNKVVYTESKAHRDHEHSVVIAAQEEKLAKKSSHPCSDILSP
jgi:hypothetical protein